MGRLSAAAAEADFRSAEADLAGARLLVAAEVVRLWFDLGFAKAETALLARECAVRERALALLTTREKNGLVSEAEPLRAGLATETAKAELEQATLRVGLLRNALVAAIGATPGEPGVTEPGELATVPVPVIREQVPASLLRTRPDIAPADLRLDAVLAREGAARANFYPNITLSASGGFSSINAGDLFNSSSRVWSFGPTLSLPILTGGKNDAALESARAHFDDAWAAYRRSVLTAFRETEDALLSLDKLRVRERRLADADHAAGRSLAIAHTRRDKGLSSEVEVTLAERDALHANRERLRAHHDVLVASAGLARALGGGWDRAVSPEQQPVAVEP